MASGFVWALRYFSWRYLLHGIQFEKPATVIYEPSPSSGLLLRMLCWQMTYETKKMWSYIWNLKKRSWFLTNQSCILELEGAMHLFSNLSVGMPQLACFGGITWSGSSATTTIGTMTAAVHTLPAKWWIQLVHCPHMEKWSFQMWGGCWYEIVTWHRWWCFKN